MSYLPATTYVAPPRLGRGRPLKTIKEAEECNFGVRSDSEGDDSDRTIRAKPVGLDARLATGAPARSRLSTSSTDSTCSISQSPIASSPCSSVGDGSLRGDSYTGSDSGTIFSEDSCPSLTGSNDTTFYTNSSRTSTASNQSVMSSRNKSLSILIPRDSWNTESTIKEIAYGMSPARKIMLSPQALSSLSRNLPSLSGPPSFGEGSSIASSSPCIPAMSSAPVTPELNNLVPIEGQEWQAPNQQLNTPLEIAVDEEHSLILSPREAHSIGDRTSVGYSTDWSEMVTRFPEVPGGTPQEFTPISPNMVKLKNFPHEASDNGVQLPTDALQVLQHLTRSYSPESESQQSGASRAKFEMKERSNAGDRSESPIPSTPAPSDSDFSQLSIPSPGGFFSSLQASSRATWCLSSQPKAPSMPSSAAAANFYDIPFARSQDTIETIVEAPDSALTDGPPTARQHNFAVPPEYCTDELAEEDEDMYGAHMQAKSSSPEMGHEYEDKYQEELTQQAGANIDRTSNWLTAQTTYLSALRESNPVNDPAEYIPQTPHPSPDENEQQEESPARKAVRFLEEAIRTSHASDGVEKPARAPRPKDPVFLEAFCYCLAQKGRQDVFLQAASRLERVNSTRLALPVQHIHTLLNTHTTETLQVHIRPKYRGPFSQNPRATGNFQRTNENVVFAEAERKQLAMDHILPAVWATEAQRKVLYKGHMFSCPSATRYLARQVDSTRKLRVLDLAGTATGSWAWTAAQTWPHVNFVTVQAKAQSRQASQWPAPAKDGNKKVIKPANPANHRVLAVPELWKLPFADNHFDIISTRTLHMFIRSRPVPEVPSINEWDLVLKECMRILKPGGILDYILLDSHISNNSSENDSKHSRDHSVETAASISPTAAFGQGLTSPPLTSGFGLMGPILNPAPLNFGRDLKRRGYDADGGCAKLAERLEANGFIDHQSQWVGLPVGCTGPTHDNVAASYEKFETRAPTPASTKSKVGSTSSGLQRSKIGSITHANGRSRTPFPPAPRPISEVSTISRIIEQYSNVEAVQGPVGSTADVSDLAGLLGTMMWEEWLVRHRLEVLNCKSRQTNEVKENFDITFEATNLLHGINDILAAGHAKGACFRTIVGWARKPGKKPIAKRAAVTVVPATQQQAHIQASPSRSSAIRVNTNSASLPNPTTYRARAQQRAQQYSTYQGYPSDETPTTAFTATPKSGVHYGRGFITPVEFRRQDLNLDTRTPGGAQVSPQYTQSAVDRGEVGIIPMMIVE